jgi:predicted Ser/Thr protein kinase
MDGRREFMSIQNLDKLVKKIEVKNLVNADVEVVNKSPLVMMGKGRQGAVIQLTEDICVKVFGNIEDCDREYYALSLGQETNLFPKLYGKGPLYIAMEIIRGVDLREYLQSQPLTPALSAKLLEMLITFKKIGYERIDHHKRQIYLQPDGSLKVIDVARTVWRDRVYPYPRKLLTSLGEENKAVFLTHVQEMAPEVYEEWLHYIRMEEISRKITEILLPEEPDKKTLKILSKSLQTTKDEKQYVLLLEGLVHKVFKEEWVKLMLARGVDIDKIMGQIDAYWDNLELEFENRHLGGAKQTKSEKRFQGEKPVKVEKRYEGEKLPKGNREVEKKNHVARGRTINRAQQRDKLKQRAKGKGRP